MQLCKPINNIPYKIMTYNVDSAHVKLFIQHNWLIDVMIIPIWFIFNLIEKRPSKTPKLSKYM